MPLYQPHSDAEAAARVLAHPHRALVHAAVLNRGPLSVADLRVLLPDLSAADVSTALTQLRQAGLVERDLQLGEPGRGLYRARPTSQN